MNKYNIEVGDTIDNVTVNYVTNDGIIFNKINSSIYVWKWEFLNRNIDTGAWKITSQKNKMNKKIIGYTLLKDTPEFNAGMIFESAIADDNGDTIYVPSSGKYENNDSYWYSVEDVTSKPEWFSPIYEEVKPTEVYVDTLAGKVKVTKDKLSINGSEYLKMCYATALIDNIKGKLEVATTIQGYAVKLETFKVGCKTFHVLDIPKIEEAIKQVS